MTRQSRLWIGVFLGFSLYALCSCTQVTPLTPVNKAGTITGQAEMRRSGTVAWARIRPETILYVGDTIRAREATSVAFLDGTLLSLSAGTEASIAAFDPQKNMLRLQTGLATLVTDNASANIQISESAVDIAVVSGFVNVLDDGKWKRVESGQVARIVAEQPLAVRPQDAPTTTPQPPISTVTFTATSLPQKTPTPKPSGTSAPVPTPTGLIIRVNCGGPQYRDKQGRLWSADKQYKAGDWGYTGGLVYTTGNAIAKTDDDLLYQSERWGDFFYLFDIPNGKYKVTLYFAEIYRDNPGVRKFSVRIEGHWVLSELDLAAVAGRDVAYQQAFTVDLADRQLGIEFIKQFDNPKVNAISIEAIR